MATSNNNRVSSSWMIEKACNLLFQYSRECDIDSVSPLYTILAAFFISLSLAMAFIQHSFDPTKHGHQFNHGHNTHLLLFCCWCAY